MSDKLEMTFDPMTIEHLGVRMYSTLPPVLGELIANSYDADASYVKIYLHDEGEKEIIIEDDGMGMSFDEINTKFLRIGRNRREEGDAGKITPKGRKVIGKKGLGKLSFFGITHEIEVSTWKDRKRTSFIMNWDAIKKGHEEGGDKLGNYSPNINERDVNCDAGHGTKITLKKIQRQSKFSPHDIAESLSKIFICDSQFKIFVMHKEHNPIEVTDELKYNNLDKEICWNIPADITVQSDYKNASKISGKVFTASKPISPKSNMRGVTLFSRKKMVNAPEYFSESSSSHFYSYLTGWLEVDFIDDLPVDVIGTNRQSLNWDHPEMKELREHLQILVRALASDWRTKRKEKRTQVLSAQTGVNISNWFSKVPKETEQTLARIVNAVIDDSELTQEESSIVVRGIHELVPEYPQYHWRHLHPEVRAAAEADYKGEDYYRAFLEAAKRYITRTRTKSGSSQSDQGMMGEVYGRDKPLSVTSGYKKPDGDDFNKDTLENIEEGQKFLSMGIVAGGRNPVSHEEIRDLRESGLFSEKDCLDGLSLLSHLLRRLNDA